MKESEKVYIGPGVWILSIEGKAELELGNVRQLVLQYRKVR